MLIFLVVTIINKEIDVKKNKTKKQYIAFNTTLQVCFNWLGLEPGPSHLAYSGNQRMSFYMDQLVTRLLAAIKATISNFMKC